MHALHGLSWALLLLAAPASGAAGPLTAARLQALLAAPHTFATQAGKAAFDAHFADSCMAVEGLPFDSTCTHVPLADRDDPSPWPDVFLGLRGHRIVAAIVVDARWAPRSWRCTRLPGFDGPRLCTPPDVPPPVRRDWARRWSTVLRAAG